MTLHIFIHIEYSEYIQVCISSWEDIADTKGKNTMPQRILIASYLYTVVKTFELKSTMFVKDNKNV